jgi:hypothetical protein
MFGMSFPLDVLFLDRLGRVVTLYENLQPGQRTKMVKDAEYALELPAGTIAVTGTREGDLMSWTPAEEIRARASGNGSGTLGRTFGRLRPDATARESTAQMGVHA